MYLATLDCRIGSECFQACHVIQGDDCKHACKTSIKNPPQMAKLACSEKFLPLKAKRLSLMDLIENLQNCSGGLVFMGLVYIS